MSIHTQSGRKTVPDIMALRKKRPVVCLTSYHAHTARLVDPYVDLLLVGDSLGMVMHGFETTIPVTLELMIFHAAAVVRGSRQALVVFDMPFGSYEESPQVAFRNAARAMKETGCGAVKLEGGVYMEETVSYLTARGIPVMAHIGLTPQSVHTMGGFKTRGREESEWAGLEADLEAVQKAGAFAVVLEGVAEPLAVHLTQQSEIPVIGIGASSVCDGQILVLEDMLGLSPQVPKFVKKFGNLGEQIADAVRTYADEVTQRKFPDNEHVYNMKKKTST